MIRHHLLCSTELYSMDRIQSRPVPCAERHKILASYREFDDQQYETLFSDLQRTYLTDRCIHPVVPVFTVSKYACSSGIQFSKTRLVRIDETITIQVLVQLVESKFFKEPVDNRQHRYWPIIRLFGFLTIFENW